MNAYLILEEPTAGRLNKTLIFTDTGLVMTAEANGKIGFSRIRGGLAEIVSVIRYNQKHTTNRVYQVEVDEAGLNQIERLREAHEEVHKLLSKLYDSRQVVGA